MKNFQIKLIKNSPLLNTIPEEEILKALSSRAIRIVNYEANTVIHFDEDLCYKLEVILSGKVSIDRIDESGNLFTVAEFYPNDILGSALMFSKNPRYPMTITAQYSSTILEISKDFLLDLCFNNRDFLMYYLELISDTALLLGVKIKHYANRSIRESIISYLKQESQKQKTLQIKLTSTKKGLAEKIGAQRTSLSRELQKMKKEGLLLFDAKSITILDSSILD